MSTDLLNSFNIGRDNLEKFINTHMSLGWIIMLIPHHLMNDYNSKEINYWINDNLKGNVSKFSYIWFFEQKEDAVLFKLRWL